MTATGARNHDDDAAAFVEAVRGARKLRGVQRVAPGFPGPATGPILPIRPPIPMSARGGAVPRLPAGQLATRPATGDDDPTGGTDAGAGDAWSLRANGIDGRVLRKLRGGAVRVDARVDLHGLTRARAVADLEKFLLAARAAGRRCVVIIHGRGLHSGAAGPALRDAVRAALVGRGMASAILAACTAPAAEGGAGATLVLLRR